MGIIQEKYDYVAPEPVEPSKEWATPASARRSYRGPTHLPLPNPKMEFGTFNQSTSGNQPKGKDAGDVSQVLNGKSIREGYAYSAMKPTDDAYTNEHKDSFYDTIEVDGRKGFVERNNYLDRE